ncbi:unnamed protein product [Protopolystoma xenopodis]|uniref:Uncharacterized protein n=1 Tax=Protopolystoma xenopodis TaxID=117903 RepID=A0A3S5A1I6_9PLAT|nr:unnamed protein product [Protopolystoma xenopodis]
MRFPYPIFKNYKAIDSRRDQASSSIQPGTVHQSSIQQGGNVSGGGGGGGGGGGSGGASGVGGGGNSSVCGSGGGSNNNSCSWANGSGGSGGQAGAGPSLSTGSIGPLNASPTANASNVIVASSSAELKAHSSHSASGLEDKISGGGVGDSGHSGQSNPKRMEEPIDADTTLALGRKAMPTSILPTNDPSKIREFILN